MTLRKAALLLLILSLGTCNQAIMVAPPGSTFADPKLVANPEFIAAHGDVSVISGLLLDGTGNPVPDGTVVQFFTTLGRIDEQGKTNDGVVRVNLVSDSRSGTAHVTAISGGEGTTVTTAAAAPPVRAASSMSITGGTSVLAAAASATVDVIIGSARPHSLFLTPRTARITTGGSVALTARVFDEAGNPVTNVPVIFTITQRTTGVTARLDSNSAPIFTNSNGEAIDILRTNSLLSGEVTVQAVTSTGQSDSVTVQIN